MVPITPRVQTSDQMGKRNRRNEHEMHILSGNIHFGIYRRPCPAIGPMGLNNSEVGAVLREVRTQLNKERLVRRDLDNALSIFAMEAIMEAITCRRLLEAMSCRGSKVLLQVTYSKAASVLVIDGTPPTSSVLVLVTSQITLGTFFGTLRTPPAQRHPAFLLAV